MMINAHLVQMLVLDARLVQMQILAQLVMPLKIGNLFLKIKNVFARLNFMTMTANAKLVILILIIVNNVLI